MNYCKAWPGCSCIDGCLSETTGLSVESLRSLSLILALNEEGVHEEGGDNHGARVNWYQEEGGSGDGTPWCADFVNYCAKWAADTMRVHSPLEDVANQAYVQSYVDHFTKIGGKVTKNPRDGVQPGHLFAIWFPTLQRYGHIGFVKSLDLDKWTFETQEGNSNDEGSREGKEVCSNTRAISSHVVFIKWSD